MACSDGSTSEPKQTLPFLRTSVKLMWWSGTAILRTMSDLADSIFEAAFPEHETSSSPTPPASPAFTRSVGEPTTPPSITPACQEQHLFDLDSHYTVASDGPWFVMHAEPLRNMLYTIADGGDTVTERQESAEALLADFEVECNLHGDEGDHPEILDPDVAEQLTRED